MKALSIFLYVSLAALLSGCVLKYEDVSDDSQYEPLVNNRYVLSTNMFIYGVNLPPGYGVDINQYFILPSHPPQVSGREYISKEVLGKGVTLKVQGIKRSINHLPGFQEIDAIIEVKPYKKTSDVPVVIDLRYIQSTNYMRRVNH